MGIDYKGKQERRRAQKRRRKTSNSDQFVCLTVFLKSGSISQLNRLVKDYGETLWLYSLTLGDPVPPPFWMVFVCGNIRVHLTCTWTEAISCWVIIKLLKKKKEPALYRQNEIIQKEQRTGNSGHTSYDNRQAGKTEERGLLSWGKEPVRRLFFRVQDGYSFSLARLLLGQQKFFLALLGYKASSCLGSEWYYMRSPPSGLLNSIFNELPFIFTQSRSVNKK